MFRFSLPLSSFVYIRVCADLRLQQPSILCMHAYEYLSLLYVCVYMFVILLLFFNIFM